MPVSFIPDAFSPPGAAAVAPVLSVDAWRGGLAVAGVALALGGALLPRLRGWRRADAWTARAAAE